MNSTASIRSRALLFWAIALGTVVTVFAFLAIGSTPMPAFADEGNGTDLVANEGDDGSVDDNVDGDDEAYTPYVKTVKKFKLGSRDFRKRLDKHKGNVVTYKSIDGKLKITPKKGWKIKSIKVEYRIFSKNTLKLKYKKVKNGAWLKSTSKRSVGGVEVVMKNKKTGATQELSVFIAG